ncbi:biotin transporter BioY [Sediminispirochaeta smaragdinae]|uniref:Biotin transporter n=1 Tax=Sediminispirochaeta smaragdinae (strain DSM 11293 / JCM 15392 / SEBR 4228) TaxID=573413 RepID=E1R508_SEDSS|nr:biotin transporter BioY [Sediminispirochaeta smaragdinae]ADK80543.1 BioY protein [Sediminispirochaeta smaragdinae DSM 11293]
MANNDTNKAKPLASMVFAALFSALISAGAYIAIPLGPVPLVMQNFFVFLTALLLRPRDALFSILLYLAIGSAGLPVFSGGTGGIAHFFGPTGGYLLAYLPAMIAGSFIAHLRREKGSKTAALLINFSAALVAALITYIIGLPWLKIAAGISWKATLAAGLYPFIIGDIVKICAAAVLAIPLRERLEEILHG